MSEPETASPASSPLIQIECLRLALAIKNGRRVDLADIATACAVSGWAVTSADLTPSALAGKRRRGPPLAIAACEATFRVSLPALAASVVRRLVGQISGEGLWPEGVLDEPRAITFGPLAEIEAERIPAQEELEAMDDARRLLGETTKGD